MKKEFISLDNWPRRHHYQAFLQMERPHFSICSSLDISEVIKRKQVKLFPAMLYSITRAANEIDEFKTRIINKDIIKFKSLDVCFNILAEDGLFSNHRMCCDEKFSTFQKQVSRAISLKSKKGLVDIDPNQEEDMILTSFIPWINFTSVSEPLFNKFDSIPRVTWGKYNEIGQMPISIQVHHALMDGIHVGEFLSKLQVGLESLELGT